MNKLNLRLFGWHLKLKLSDLEVYKIIFRQVTESERKKYLIIKFKRGEYDSKSPFGIFFDSNQLYYVKSKKVLKNEYIVIDKDYGEVGKNIIKQDIKKDGISLLVKTYIDHILHKEGYLKPYNSRGCLGKYSKGVLSKREIKSCISKEETGLEKDYFISPAENFDLVFINENELFIIYLPRFIVFDEGFSLPQSPNVQYKIQNTSTWLRTVFQSYEKFHDRFLDLDKILRIKFKQWNFIESIELIEDFNFSRINRPEKILLKDKIVEIEGDTNFKSQLSHLLTKINLNISNQILMEDSLDEFPIISEFINDFKKRNLNHQEEIEKFDRSIFYGNYIPKNNSDTITFILNNKNPGNEYYYNLIKTNLTLPNKIVNYKTIEKNRDKWDDIINSIILSLYARFYNKALYNIPIDFYEKIISLNFIMDFNYEIKVLFYGIYDLTNNRIIFKSELLPWDIKDEDVLTRIKELNVDGEKSCFLLDSNALITKILKKNFKDFKADIIRIKKLNGRIFETSDDSIINLDNGVYIKLTDKKFLLITTGYPEYIFDNKDNLNKNIGGLPNPLYIKLDLKNTNYSTALKLIYHHSFVNLETTSKNLYPYILHYVMSMPYYYNLKKNQILLEEHLLNYEEI